MWPDFKRKPRDGAVGGYPLRSTTQLASVVETNAAFGPLRVWATVYDPTTDESDVRLAFVFSSTLTDYSREVGGPSIQGIFGDGEILTAVGISATVPNTGQTHLSVFVYEGGAPVCQLIGDFVSSAKTPSWTAGSSPRLVSSMFSPETPGKLYTFQGTVVNGAGGAGNQSLETVAPAGGRIEVLNSRILNGDTVARVVQAEIDDASGGNVIAIYESVSANAGTSHEQPLGSVASAAASTFASGIQPIIVAGANVYRLSVASVAASQDSAYALLLRVWGGTPTFTLAGASTPTLTTNTSRFEGG